jgi:hypothetical protein
MYNPKKEIKVLTYATKKIKPPDLFGGFILMKRELLAITL